MKKSVIFVITVIFIIVIFSIVSYNNKKNETKEILFFNEEYEKYNTQELNGYDIVSLINKAISNNEKYEIEKNNEGIYILDDEYSIEIYITMALNDTTFPMESINKLGMNSFITNFGEVGFRCTDIKYHKKTGRIASMTFESAE